MRNNAFFFSRALACATVSLLALSAALAATSASAQQAAANPNSGVTEVIVTAQKRSTFADKTPVSITALSGADILARGVTSFADLAAGTPGVSIKEMGPGQTEFEMRGMTSSGGNSPTVGFYLDDIPLTSPAAAQNGKVVIDPSLYDLSQVEVLRGPQGTLYGSSSMGGTVKLVTNKPKLGVFDFSDEITGSGTAHGGGNNAENAMVNIPLGDKVALRVVASQSNTSGWIDRIVVGNFPVATDGGIVRGDVADAPVLADHKGSNAESTQGARVALLWRPVEELTVTPTFFYQRTHQDGPSDYDSDPGTMAHYQPFDIAEPYTDDIKIASLDVNYHLPAFDLTSATSAWWRRSTMIQDNSENLPSVGGGFGVTTDSASYYGPTGTGPIYADEIDPSRQFSEELRLTSNGEGKLKWLVGAYFANFKSSWQLETEIQNPSSFGSSTPQIFDLTQPTEIKQYAVFGETGYAVTDKLSVTLGLRAYSYDTTLDMVTSGYGSPTGDASAITQHVGQSSSGVNPKLDISYQADANTLFYATISRGFRPGGGNQPLPSSGSSPIAPSMYAALVGLGYANGVAPLSYGPDHLWSYEIGNKVKLFDKHLRINTSLYYEDWSNIQLEELPDGYPLFDNVDRAKIYGGELEVQAVLTSHLTLGTSVGYSHATLADSSHGFTAGERLPDVPEWSGGGYIAYSHNLDHGYTFNIRADDTFVGDRVGLATYQGIVNSSNAPLPAYSLVNLRTGVASEKGWTLSLFVNNLTNKRAYLENAAELGLPNASYNRVVTNQPRTVGVDLSFHM